MCVCVCVCVCKCVWAIMCIHVCIPECKELTGIINNVLYVYMYVGVFSLHVAYSNVKYEGIGATGGHI